MEGEARNRRRSLHSDSDTERQLLPPSLPNDVTKFLESVVAMSGGGITGTICRYEQYQRSNGWGLDPSLVTRRR